MHIVERQKISRKIKQLKAQLGADVSSKASVSEPDNQLFELRVDLNYILARWTSLFILIIAANSGSIALSEAGTVHFPIPTIRSSQRQHKRHR